jgi:drug/metabolite transporter (DMT)-like permease
VLSAVLGVGAALAWGLADFYGGMASRTAAAVAVLAVAQTIAFALLAAGVVLLGAAPPGGDFVLYAMLGGVAEVTALAAFYTGLARGAMGVVAPVSAIAGVVPLVVGLAGGEPASAVRLAGMIVALLGMVATAIEPGRLSRRAAAGAGLALVSAVSFGVFYVAFAEAARRGDALWAVLVNRATMVALLLAAVALFRPRLPRAPRVVLVLVAIGVLDIVGTALYAVATRHGPVSIVGVLASGYPVVTVILARIVLGERLHALQRAGSAVALAGVVLINV